MSPEEGVKFLFLFLLLGGAVWVLRPIGKAIARKLEGQAGADVRAFEQTREEMLGEMDGLRQEVAQLSERLDFTERMLAKQQTEQSKIGPGAR